MNFFNFQCIKHLKIVSDFSSYLVFLLFTTEKVWNIYYGPNDGDLSKKFLKHFKKGQTTMSYLQKAITALPAQSHDLPQKDFGDSSTGN